MSIVFIEIICIKPMPWKKLCLKKVLSMLCINFLLVNDKFCIVKLSLFFIHRKVPFFTGAVNFDGILYICQQQSHASNNML